MIYKDRTCCFLGDATLPQEKTAVIKKRLEEVIDRLLSQGYDCFICCGTNDFSILSAYAVIRRKIADPAIRLLIFLPDPLNASQEEANQLLRELCVKSWADQIIPLSEETQIYCRIGLAHRLADDSNCFIVYSTRRFACAGRALRYAKRHGLAATNLAEASSP